MSFMPGWKVVNSTRRGLTSCSARWDNSLTVYRLDQWTLRRNDNGPLAVFDTFENAYNFSNLPMHYIHQCLYIPSIDRELWYMAFLKRITNRGLTHSWTGLITSSITNDTAYCPYPQGTVFADAVMLTGENNEIRNKAYVWT